MFQSEFEFYEKHEGQIYCCIANTIPGNFILLIIADKTLKKISIIFWRTRPLNLWLFIQQSRFQILACDLLSTNRPYKYPIKLVNYLVHCTLTHLIMQSFVPLKQKACSSYNFILTFYFSTASWPVNVGVRASHFTIPF